MIKQHEEFCNLIKEYRTGLFRVANGILKNNIDAEDAVSETIYKAFANLHKLRSFDSFKPWLMKILINEAYGIIRERKKTEPLEEMSVGTENHDIDEALELWNAINLLNIEFRLVTVLFYYEDMSIKEISKILKLPIGTVNSRLNRSREKLKIILSNKELPV